MIVGFIPTITKALGKLKPNRKVKVMNHPGMNEWETVQYDIEKVEMQREADRKPIGAHPTIVDKDDLVNFELDDFPYYVHTHKSD